MSEVTPDSAVTQELLRGVNANDSTAFESLFGRHRDFLRRVVQVRLDPKLRARIDPSDVVQETELEAYRRLDDYLRRKPMPFRLWLRKTACERLTMLRRRHVHAARRSVDLEQNQASHSTPNAEQNLPAGRPTPSKQFGQRKLAERVREAIDALPEADRQILLMRQYEGLTHEEAARVLEIEPATARKRYGRALLRLHRLLAESGLTESQI